MGPTKVVYLIGAGASHAEIANLYPDKITDHLFLKTNGLLLKQVSERVIEQGKIKRLFRQSWIKRQLSPAGLSDIELFIGLLSLNRDRVKSEAIVSGIKKLIRFDIEHVLTNGRMKRIYLHKALLELHQLIKQKEKLDGIITLNYDNVLDSAYSKLAVTPDYGLHTIENQNVTNKLPLLKLHGGFDLSYRSKLLPIMTPGLNKNYLELPYNFVWGRALELLIECDILRVIGCSLSTNDIGLIDLIFKSYLIRNRDPFEIQMITHNRDNSLGNESTINSTQKSYGFFPNIKTALEIENRLITDVTIQDHTTGSNPFKIWLKAKVERAQSEKVITYDQLKRSRYIIKLFV